MFGFASRIAHSYRQYRNFRAAEAELGLLGDRELADLGIARADIGRAVRGSFR